jgi:hypothetical protein
MKITLTWDAALTTGPLAGTSFPGTCSYDTSGTTGIGTEYVDLDTIAFTLGVPWSKANLVQGGQMITQDGLPAHFTAAFTPPAGSPVNDLAFGFGGPGVIGYERGGVFGEGTATLRLDPLSNLLLELRRLLRWIAN